MIYLTRTTIEQDGTRTTETAVLEGPGRLKAYEAQGWQPSTYEVWKAAQDRNIALTFDRLFAAARQVEPRPADKVRMRCPQCSSLLVSLCTGATRRRCRRCGHVWSVQERGS